MDIYELRRERLNLALNELCSGKQKVMALAVERQADYISSCITGRRHIGEKFARHVEAALRLPLGWLDEEDAPAAQLPAPLSGEEDVLVKSFRALTQSQRNELLEKATQQARHNSDLISELISAGAHTAKIAQHAQ